LALASDLGFVRAGVASVLPFSSQQARLDEYIGRGYSGEMAYLAERDALGRPLRAEPQLILPEARSILCVALPYEAPEPRKLGGRSKNTCDLVPNSELRGEVARYAQGADYHLILKGLLLDLADQIADTFGHPIIARACVDTAPVFERDLAERAGFAFIGKNTLAIAPGFGSHFLLGELFLDVDLEPSPDPLPSGCGSCSACIDVCPTQAFIGPHLLDARKCVSYLTIESRSPIPRHLRSRLGAMVFGCDLCQSVCPFNHSSKARPVAPALTPRQELSAPSLVSLLQQSKGEHKRLVRATALRRVTRDQLARNAAVALGNSGSQAAVKSLLQTARTHSSTDVRVHAAWALAELAHHHQVAEAQAALVALDLDGDPAVRAELAAFGATGPDLHPLEESSGSHAASDTHRN
jgi:epoxyqueuosine reductase